MKAKRPPIVAVLGHVDHGKTTLLDALRKSRVALREAGGITQGIGASVVSDKDGNDITFIDTPGHAAFNKMRSRGANLADIALLIVAANDGVKPQTLEALKFIREAGASMIVVFTKIDLPAANTDVALGQLEKEGVLFEGRGGDTPFVMVSAKENKGLAELLEMIVLLAEVAEISADPEADLQAQVIETNKDRRGPLVTLVVKDGTLKSGDTVYSASGSTKIRGIFDWELKPQKQIKPGYPAQILGFSDLPEVGTVISTKEFATQVKEKEHGNSQEAELNVVLKAQSAGSLEAVEGSLPEGVAVLRSSVGELSDSDVLFAKDANVSVFVFESKVPGQVKKLAETEGVEIYEFQIIYELLDKIREILEGGREKVLGEAEVLQGFPFNDKQVAGCVVKKGTIGKKKQLVLMRGDEELGRAKAASLKKQKLDVEVVSQGEEFGVILSPQLDFKRGDVLLSVED